MLKSLLIFSYLFAGPVIIPDPPPAPPPPEDEKIVDSSECNHPALQIKELKLVYYQADFKTDFAYAIYWARLTDYQVRRIVVTRGTCKAPWLIVGVDVIKPYSEKL